MVRYGFRPEHTRAVYASHWPFTSASSQLSEHLLTSLGLHKRVGNVKSITVGLNVGEQVERISYLLLSILRRVYPRANFHDYISEVDRLIFRFHSEVRGLNDRCSAIFSSDRGVVGKKRNKKEKSWHPKWPWWRRQGRLESMHSASYCNGPSRAYSQTLFLLLTYLLHGAEPFLRS